MASGAVAGMAEHMLMYPVDTVKTRMQALGPTGQGLHAAGVFRAVRVILLREGVGGLFRGIGAMALGAGPAHAVYFTTYEVAKEGLGGNRGGHQPLATAGAGATATIVADAVMTPADVVKQRLQLANSPYTGIWNCFSRMLRDEGLRPFYRSYGTTLFMNVPYTAIHFSAYESGKRFLRLDDEQEGIGTQLTAGALAGGTAASVTTPFDVVKTRLQTEGVCTTARYGSSGVFGVMRQIVETEGPWALTRGMGPRVLFHMPAAAICFTTYEICKAALIGVGK